MGIWKRVIKIIKSNFWGYFIFWSWNTVAALTAIFFLLPFAFVSIFKGISSGLISPDVAIYVSLIILSPIISIILGFSIFRKKPQQLMRLFYGIEMPLFFLMLFKLFIFNQFLSGTLHLFIIFLVALIGYSLFMIISNKEGFKSNSPAIGIFLTISSAVGILIGAYFSCYILLLLTPEIINIISSISSFASFSLDLSQLYYLPSLILSIVFFTYTFAVLIAMPIMFTLLNYKQMKVVITAFTPTIGKVIPIGIAVIAIVGNIIVFQAVNNSKPIESLAILEGENISNDDKLLLLHDRHKIREILLNTYLAPDRYLSYSEKKALANDYARAFGTSDSGVFALFMQDIGNFLGKPFIYNGDYFSDKERATKLYYRMFDADIEDAESDYIHSAQSSSWNFDRGAASASMLDRDQKKVLILEQKIDIEEHGDTATVQIKEIYENQTWSNEEVVFHFSLPEEAVITGVWLSDNASEPKKHQFIVAPRGAAQKVYKKQVTRNIDPALLQQVGPQQYRLRAFPIPRRTSTGNGYGSKADKFYIWFEYKTVISDDGWQLPKLLEKRNVFWNEKTDLIINGQKVKRPSDKWLPKSVSAKGNTSLIEHTSYLQDSINGNNITVIAKPRDLLLPKDIAHKNQSIKVLIDSSYSMIANTQAIKAQLKNLYSLEEAGKIELESFYCDGEDILPLKNNDMLNMIFWGNQHISSCVEKFLSKIDSERPIDKTSNTDLIIILTDEGNYEHSSKITVDLKSKLPPLWIIHLNDTLPYSYEDSFIEMIYKSGGGIAKSVNEAITKNTFSDNSIYTSYTFKAPFALTENYLWFINETNSQKSAETTPNHHFTSFAAKQLIQSQIKLISDGDLSSLDKLHQIAKDTGIVTNFSSMVVLVNEEQKKDLEKESNSSDRFDREVDNAGIANSKAIPEPKLFILLFAGLIILMLRQYKRYSLYRPH